MLKTSEQNPTETVLAAASSEQSGDSEFHLETQRKIDTKVLIESDSVTKSRKSLLILNSENNFTSKKLKKSSRI